MDWYWIFAFVGVGLGAGVLSGLLGISGGVITVPCLLLIFRAVGLPADSLMHVAVGTSLSSMAFNSFSSMMAHHRRRTVVWDAVFKMLPGLVLGSIGGATIAGAVSSNFLQAFFGGFELFLGFYFLFPKRPREDGHPLPTWGMLAGSALVISGVATLLGIGGGLLVAPLLLFLGFRMKHAIGTSAGVSFLVCSIGAISFLVVGLESGEVIPGCIGYVHFPAFLTIMLTAPFAAVVGAYLLHSLPVKLIRRIFGFALIGAGALLLW